MNASTGLEPGNTLMGAGPPACTAFRGRFRPARPFKGRRAWRAMWMACVWLAVSGLLLSTPRLAAATPLSAGLQRLVEGTTGASAPHASPAQAASAPAPASNADLARTLDNLIGTLDNDTQRTALVTKLKKLRDAAQYAPAARSTGGAEQRFAWHDCIRHCVCRDGSERGPHALALLVGAVRARPPTSLEAILRRRERGVVRPGPAWHVRDACCAGALHWPVDLSAAAHQCALWLECLAGTESNFGRTVEFRDFGGRRHGSSHSWRWRCSCGECLTRSAARWGL